MAGGGGGGAGDGEDGAGGGALGTGGAGGELGAAGGGGIVHAYQPLAVGAGSALQVGTPRLLSPEPHSRMASGMSAVVV